MQRKRQWSYPATGGYVKRLCKQYLWSVVPAIGVADTPGSSAFRWLRHRYGLCAHLCAFRAYGSRSHLDIFSTHAQTTYSIQSHPVSLCESHVWRSFNKAARHRIIPPDNDFLQICIWQNRATAYLSPSPEYVIQWWFMRAFRHVMPPGVASRIPVIHNTTYICDGALFHVTFGHL